MFMLLWWGWGGAVDEAAVPVCVKRFLEFAFGCEAREAVCNALGKV
jgi:hypothetical protein